jgi:cell division protein DivIC
VALQRHENSLLTNAQKALPHARRARLFLGSLNWNKVITSVYVALFAGVAIWSGLFFLELYRDLSLLRTQEAHNRRKLSEAQAKLAEQQRYLERLRSDPALVEEVIRKKLRYVREDEFIFRFPDDKRLP